MRLLCVHQPAGYSHRCPLNPDTVTCVQVETFPYYTGTDPSLAGFLAKALGGKCPSPTCSEGPAAHMHTYLHGGSLLAFSVTSLPRPEALPGADHGQIWFWMRPQQVCCSLPPPA